MQHLRALPEVCAEYDQGGGVACGDVFIVFTQTQIPDRYLTQLCSLELQNGLTKAALAVELVVNIYMSQSDLEGQKLRSLPALQSTSPLALDQKPWFFLNAAKVDSQGIGIAGRGDAHGGALVVTLLAVLSRPWCILELCYSGTSSIESLFAFAILACQLDVAAYTPAKILLSHERSHRLLYGSDIKGSATVESMRIPKPIQPRKAKFEYIRELCAALFIISENSYSGFWMRAICVCALTLDVSISMFGSSLSGSTTAFTEVKGGDNSLHWVVKRQFEGKRMLNNNKRYRMPLFEERIRAEALTASYFLLTKTFSEKTLPQMYEDFLLEIIELAI